MTDSGSKDPVPQYGPPAHAVLRPDAPALVVDGEVTTYAELGDRCRRLAHSLRGLGDR